MGLLIPGRLRSSVKGQKMAGVNQDLLLFLPL